MRMSSRVLRNVAFVLFAFTLVALHRSALKADSDCNGAFFNCTSCDWWPYAPFPTADYHNCFFDCDVAASECADYCASVGASYYGNSCNWDETSQISSGQCGCYGGTW
jgi:hypothetical protein